MHARGQHQWTDYYKGQLLHQRPPTWARIVIYIFIAIWLVGLLTTLWLAIQGEFHWAYVFLGIVFAVFLLTVRFFITPRQVRRTFAQQKELGVPWEIRVTGAGLEIANEFGDTLRPWNHFIKWKEDDHLLLLYESDAVYRILPKRFFESTDQIGALKRMLAEHQVPLASGPVGCAWILLLMMILIGATVLFTYAPGR